MGGARGSHPSNTGHKVMAGAHRTSGPALSRRPVSQDVFFSEACASAHQRPRLSTLLSPLSPSGRKQDVPALTREHLRGGGGGGWGRC